MTNKRVPDLGLQRHRVEDGNMNQIAELYDSFAAVFNYPEQNYRDQVKKCGTLVKELYPDNSEAVAQFSDFVSQAKDSELEELYVRTFDVQAICCLEVGYSVFGEDYKRGQFLAHMKPVYREKEVDCGSELPDFLSNILRLIPKLNYGDAAELVKNILLPGLDKMISGFDNKGNVYRYPMEAVRNVLSKDYT